MTIENLREEIKRLKLRLRNAEDLIEDCGYCRNCFWDEENIRDIAEILEEPVWPSDCIPLCDLCHEKLEEMLGFGNYL